MLYSADISIPKNTMERSPASVIMGISRGVITKFMIRPRPGHAGLAHCVILYHNHPIAPTSGNMDIHGDEFPIDWEDQVEVLEEPFTLEIVGWNEDDTYDHTFTIFVVILPKSALLAHIVVDAISGLFRLIVPIRLPGSKK